MECEECGEQVTARGHEQIDTVEPYPCPECGENLRASILSRRNWDGAEAGEYLACGGSRVGEE